LNPFFCQIQHLASGDFGSLMNLPAPLKGDSKKFPFLLHDSLDCPAKTVAMGTIDHE
jgi:hypothetical protein